jgi:ribose transport system permease protein
MTQIMHAASPSAAPRAGYWRDDASEPIRRNLGLIGVLLILLIVGAVSRPDIFLHFSRFTGNETIVLRQAASIGVVAVGMTFVMVSGGIDLSVGALLALASVWSTTAATQSYGPGMVIVSALVVGTVAGTVNGILIAYGRMVPFIATLATMVAARGLAQKISGKLTQIVHVNSINRLAVIKVLGIPLLVIIFLVVAGLAWILLNRTTFGRQTVAIGGNSEAARLAGINIRRHTLLIYALSGLCCGIAAVMVTSLANAGSSTHGDLYELQAIAAAIIGGTSLAGGRGTIVGSVLGVLVFTQISNLFVVNNLQLEYQLIAQGVIIVGAVLIQQFRVTGRRRGPAPALATTGSADPGSPEPPGNATESPPTVTAAGPIDSPAASARTTSGS